MAVLRTFALAALVLVGGAAHAEKAVILVRHAEKVDDSKDPPLSQAGRARAERLAKLLAKSGVTHVFTSEYVRTKTTAEPLARALKLTPRVVPARDEAALVAAVRALPDDAVAVVVGHSNTLPSLLKAFGHGQPTTIADDEYGRVFVLVRSSADAPTLLEIAY